MIAGLIVTVYLARILGPEGFGIIGFGTALLAYFTLALSLGLDTLGTREIARDQSRVAFFAGHILAIRLALLLLTGSLYVGTVYLLVDSSEARLVLFVLGLSLIGHAITLEWVYVGVERMGVLATRNVLAGIVSIGVMLLFVRTSDDTVWGAAAIASGVVAAALWVLISFRRDFGSPPLTIDFSEWGRLLRPAIPIGASAVMIAVYHYIDQIMLGLMRGEAEVGIYTAAYRIMVAAVAPAAILFNAFLPTLSKSVGNLAVMQRHMKQYATVMAAIGLPIMTAGVLMAPGGIRVLYGPDYAQAEPVMVVLMLSVGLIFVNMTLGNPLLAWDKQRVYFFAIAAGAVANVGLNLVLIPSFGSMGAAWATVSSESVVLAGLAILHYQAARSLYIGIWARGIAAAGTSGFLVWIILSWTPLAGHPLAIGILFACVYALIAPRLGLFRYSELRSLIRPAASPETT
jgi:O-antigen/teichoic acid export membrane protein